ncbi:hypothetical protein VTL71DRAFT_4208 [Oculimacula yallundae]|uniref:Uncharacterized protein n=1 Tax=Oculimacula yallundae TaxID=86028 RepID=A0ABR4C563_9HELO
MPTIRLDLRDKLSQGLTYEHFPSKSFEVILSRSQPLLLVEQDLPLDEDVRAWVNNQGFNDPLTAEPDIENIEEELVPSLRLLYQEWSLGDDLQLQERVPFSKQTFDLLSQEFRLSEDYLSVFCQNRYTPFHVRHAKSETECTTMVFQSPTFPNFSSLVLSYDTRSGRTRGFLGYTNTRHHRELKRLLGLGLKESLHPLSIPILFYHAWLASFSDENEDMSVHLAGVKKTTDRVANPTANSNSFEEFDLAHDKINRAYRTLNNSMESFMIASAANIEAALADIDKIVTASHRDSIAQEHADLEAMISSWGITLNCLVDDRRRMKERLAVHLQVLYNMMQREDSKKTQELAEASRNIAERQLLDSQAMKDVALDSKRIAERQLLDSQAMKDVALDSKRIAERQLLDSQAMKDVALDSKRIAEATRLDSSAMKTIAILTMIFLPGTAVATIFSMSSFFESGPDSTFLVSGKFWIYLATAVPITLMVLGFWAIRTRMEEKRIRDKRK